MAVIDPLVRGRALLRLWGGPLARRRSRTGVRLKLRVWPKIAFAIGQQAMAMSHSPRALRAVEPHRTCQTGLYLEIRNDGPEPVRLDEIGLTGWFEDP